MIKPAEIKNLKPSFLLIVISLILCKGYGQKQDSLSVNIWADKLFCSNEMEDAVDDGRGNEAFVQYHWAVVNADNGTILKKGIQANLDIKMLLSGTTYPLNKMIFGDFLIHENEILVIVPVVWEQDKGGPDAVSSFNRNMSACLTMIAGQLPAKYATLRASYNSSSTGYYTGISLDLDRIRNLNWNSFTGLPSFNSLLEPVRGSGATRPVGIGSNFEFNPMVFTFSRASIRYMEEWLGNTKSGLAQVQADYAEGLVGTNTNRASYSIFISIQRKFIPAGGGIIKPVPVKTPYQVGMWTGNWDAISDGYLKMNISADGYFQLYDNYNRPRETGTYTLVNDQFTGHITLNSKNYELTGTINRNNGTLNGTWKYNDGFTSKSGTWSVKK